MATLPPQAACSCAATCLQIQLFPKTKEPTHTMYDCSQMLRRVQAQLRAGNGMPEHVEGDSGHAQHTCAHGATAVVRHSKVPPPRLAGPSDAV